MTGLPAPLLVITDRHQAAHSLETIADAVGRGGGRWLLLRDKDLDPVERKALAGRLARIARQHGMQLLVSRDVEVAADVGAAGVHLQTAAAVTEARARLGANAVIGVSAHALGDVAAAFAAQADYVTLSPIFLTASKPGYGPALGIAAIREAARFGIPVLALGGIGVDAIGPCLAAGAAGVAVMGEVMRSGDPCRAVSNLLRACLASAPERNGAIPMV